MSDMTLANLAAGAWTLLYTSGAANSSVAIVNSTGKTLRVRVGASAVSGDSIDAAHVKIPPEEQRSFGGLASGDKVYGRMSNDGAGTVAVWA